LINASAMTDTRTRALFEHRDPYVRDRAVTAVARATELTMVRSIIDRGLRDGAPIVRYRSIGVFARRLRPSVGCGPLWSLVNDTSVTVALAAIDAMSGCRPDADVTARLLE